ncbi:MAG: hypothetical protein R3C53_17955 [Pirellulaceae bacterium]
MKPKENSDQRKSGFAAKLVFLEKLLLLPRKGHKEKAKATVKSDKPAEDSSNQVEGDWQTNYNQTKATRKPCIGRLMRVYVTSENEWALLANITTHWTTSMRG